MNLIPWFLWGAAQKGDQSNIAQTTTFLTEAQTLTEAEQLTVGKPATQRHVALTTTDTGEAVKFSWRRFHKSSEHKGLATNDYCHQSRHLFKQSSGETQVCSSIYKVVKRSFCESSRKGGKGGFECKCVFVKRWSPTGNKGSRASSLARMCSLKLCC